MTGDTQVVVVGGGGHVGLPLSIVLATKGIPTLLYDTNKEVLAQIAAGVLPFMEEDAEPLLKEALRSQRLRCSSDAHSIRGAAYLIISVGTPVDMFLNPVFDALRDCIDALLPHLSDEQTIILRSTVSPGVTQWLHDYLKNRGRNNPVAFCPERVVQGFAVKEIQTLPQIVSGTTPLAQENAASLLKQVAPEIVFMKPMEAEFAKLFANAYRYVQFAVTNQFYMMATSAGLDYARILAGMQHNYERLGDLPGAGLAAGPCLYKDTAQLAAHNQNQFSLGFDAVTVNEGLPLFLIDQMAHRHDLKRLTVGLLGMAFKANSDDTRSSLSYKFKKLLQLRAKAVLCNDPHVRSDDELVPLEQVVAQSDLLVLCVPHAAYRNLDLKGKPVVDVWNFFGRGSRV
jgi:UDP-N-acetyl-D-mannosaminuronic acid dehydrogenase